MSNTPMKSSADRRIQEQPLPVEGQISVNGEVPEPMSEKIAVKVLLTKEQLDALPYPPLGVKPTNSNRVLVALQQWKELVNAGKPKPVVKCNYGPLEWGGERDGAFIKKGAGQDEQAASSVKKTRTTKKKQ